MPDLGKILAVWLTLSVGFGFWCPEKCSCPKKTDIFGLGSRPKAKTAKKFVFFGLRPFRAWSRLATKYSGRQKSWTPEIMVPKNPPSENFWAPESLDTKKFGHQKVWAPESLVASRDQKVWAPESLVTSRDQKFSRPDYFQLFRVQKNQKFNKYKSGLFL
jgi:hypothetical protein